MDGSHIFIFSQLIDIWVIAFLVIVNNVAVNVYVQFLWTYVFNSFIFVSSCSPTIGIECSKSYAVYRQKQVWYSPKGRTGSHGPGEASEGSLQSSDDIHQAAEQ